MSFEKPWGNYLLDKIVETTAPETISYFPQTIGWQLAFILLMIFIINKTYLSWKVYQSNAYRREALAWLAQCSLASEEDVRQLPALLRKTALLASQVISDNNSPINARAETLSRPRITQLSGKSWVTWLDDNCTKTTFCHQALTHSPEKLLTQLAYIPKIDFLDDTFKEDLSHLCQQIELWIKYHELNYQSAVDGSGDMT